MITKCDPRDTREFHTIIHNLMNTPGSGQEELSELLQFLSTHFVPREQYYELIRALSISDKRVQDMLTKPENNAKQGGLLPDHDTSKEHVDDVITSPLQAVKWESGCWKLKNESSALPSVSTDDDGIIVIRDSENPSTITVTLSKEDWKSIWYNFEPIAERKALVEAKKKWPELVTGLGPSWNAE